MKKYCTLTLFLISSIAFSMDQKNEEEQSEAALTFRVTDKVREFLTKQFENTTAPLEHTDDVYFFSGFQPEVDKEGYQKMNEYLRLRKGPERDQYTQERLSKLTSKKSTQNGMIECETEVSDPQAMRKMLTQLGVDKENSLEMSMRRSLYFDKYNYQLKIAVDHFFTPPHMHKMSYPYFWGSFVTVTLKSAKETYNEGIEIIKSYLREHGISEIELYPPYIEIALNPELHVQAVKKVSLDENVK